MARITIEDCLEKIPNRFELTLAATNRARQISAGSAALVDMDRDKATVVALREIAAGNVTTAMLEEPDEPVQEPVNELDAPADFRAPQLGLGDAREL